MHFVDWNRYQNNLLVTHTGVVEVLVREKRLKMCHNQAVVANTNRPELLHFHTLEILLIGKGHKESSVCNVPHIT